MYSIIGNDGVIGFCDEPRYVKLNENQIFIQTTKEEATHVAIGGVAYDLTETHVKPEDSGEFVFDNAAKVRQAGIDIIDTQDALCETSIDFEQRIADIEDALCELTEE